MTSIKYSILVPELKNLVAEFLKSSDVEYLDYEIEEENTEEDLLKAFKQLCPISVDGNHKEYGSSDVVKNSSVASNSMNVFSAMKYEKNRLESFKNWPLQSIRPTDLASAGLFYLGVRDRVQCAFCHGIITDWEAGDDPLKEHICHFPMCPFILEKDVGNVPIFGSDSLHWAQITESLPERHLSSDQMSSGTAQYPHFNNVDKRLQTYTGWSPSNICQAKDLAECGLFYTGNTDVVTCFCCGGSLGQWERGDDPWVEHAKHFPMCAYVHYVKGASFVRNVRNLSYRQDVRYFNENQVPSNIGSSASTVLEEERTRNDEATGESGKSEQQSSFACRICTEEKPRVAFLPCGHSLACPSCAEQLSVCPVCRNRIESAVRIYFD